MASISAWAVVSLERARGVAGRGDAARRPPRWRRRPAPPPAAAAARASASARAIGSGFRSPGAPLLELASRSPHSRTLLSGPMTDNNDDRPRAPSRAGLVVPRRSTGAMPRRSTDQQSGGGPIAEPNRRQSRERGPVTGERAEKDRPFRKPAGKPFRPRDGDERPFRSRGDAEPSAPSPSRERASGPPPPRPPGGRASRAEPRHRRPNRSRIASPRSSPAPASPRAATPRR